MLSPVAQPCRRYRLNPDASSHHDLTFAIEAMEHTIDHQENDAKGAFFVQKDGRRIAEMTYSRLNPSKIIVDHTEVDASLGGQGVGRKLLDALVQWARHSGTRIVPLCPFAKAQFDKDPSIRDVLA